MRIGIDCRTILNPEKGESAGIGHYTYQLVRHLIQVDTKNTYILFFDRSVQKRRLEKFRADNVSITLFPFIQYSRLMPTTSSHFLASATFAKENLDIFHSPALSLPSSYKGKSIITVHDVGVYKFPDLYLKRDVLRLKREIPYALRQADKIIVASHETAKDLGEIFNIGIHKINVIFHGLDKRFFISQSEANISAVKKKYGIGKNYFLFLGTLDPRKNIVQIISAYERFREKVIHPPEDIKDVIKSGFSQYQLVLAGAKGKKFKDIERKISHSPYNNDIILPGYIDADDLDALFEGAELFIFPSLYEGFGLPVIEAMANGVPVITSNVSSLPEVSGNSALLVDPNNVAEITQSVYNILTDVDLRKDLIDNGIQRAKIFSWETCAKQTLGIYKEVAKS